VDTRIAFGIHHQLLNDPFTQMDATVGQIIILIYDCARGTKWAINLLLELSWFSSI
jgi:hypothetical protein